MNPAEISTLPELAVALSQLRRERSVQTQSDTAENPSMRARRRPALPRSTASDLLKAKSVPTAETMVTFLADCGVCGEDSQRPWLQALERVANQHQHRPPGTVRVRDARPRILGVHAAIQTAQPSEHTQSVLGEAELPPYVPRDFDADLRTKLTLAGQQGGFVLLTGDSSVGKTRALFEAVKAVMPDWWLLHPGDAQALRAFAAQPTGRIVVWLDELQDYLEFAGGVPAGQIRELIAAGAVLVATCWPTVHSKRLALPEERQPDPYANDRRLLGLADVLYVAPAFSHRERRRAEDFADTDHRIRVALDTPDAGFTQVMAAGPELIRHWNQAPAYAKAVITAALDARRVGAHAPLTRDHLADAAPGYLNEREVATAPAGWLKDALDYATRLLRGATTALIPVAAGMGTIAGYRVADYLHQHALRARCREFLPDTAWHALIQHHHPDDAQRLADSAGRRGRDHEALTLYQQLAERGYETAAMRLIGLLIERGEVDQVRAHADNGDGYAAGRLANLLVEQGQVEDAIQLLRAHADNGDTAAVIWLDDLLAGQEQVEQLRDRADNGDGYAAYRLADLLADHGQAEDAIQLLRAHADNGDETASRWLADLLAAQGQVEQLRARADNGDRAAAYRLARRLADLGQFEDAIKILRPRADKGDDTASSWLARLLADQGQFEDAIKILRPRADNGDGAAALILADVLAVQGQLEQLRARADNGDRAAAYRLADLLAERGQVEDAIQMMRARADNGDWLIAHRLADLLAAQGQLEQLRARADNGDRAAGHRLAELLAEQGQVEELEREVAAGTQGAVDALRRAQSHMSPHFE